jgi:hypothetical protein
MRSQWLDHDTSILFKEPALADTFKTAANTEIWTSPVATAGCPFFFFFAVTRGWNVSPSKDLEASFTVDIGIFYPIPIFNRNSKSSV